MMTLKKMVPLVHFSIESFGWTLVRVCFFSPTAMVVVQLQSREEGEKEEEAEPRLCQLNDGILHVRI